MEKRNIVLFLIVILILSNSAYASESGSVTIKADYITLYPGKTGEITIEIENNFEDDLNEVSIELQLSGLPFTPIGSNHKEIDEIQEDDSKKIRFTIKAAPNANPGDYSIPYEISYKNENNSVIKKSGSFGIKIGSKSDVDFSVETQNPILGERGKISLRIINKGLGEIKFVTTEIFPQGFEVLSDKKIYIGTIDSDDEDITTFDVIFNEKSPNVIAIINYKDFENNEHKETINIPIKIYTKQEAIKLGLIKKSNLISYLIIFILLVIILVIWRNIKKRNKKRKKIKSIEDNKKPI